MKVLQINSSDLTGSRFNGFGVRDRLTSRGVESRHLVWRQLTDDASVDLAFDFPLRRQVAWGINRIEDMFSVQSALHLHWLAAGLDRRFRWADLVHYHIIHDGFFSLAALPLLTRIRPSIWTFHDPWPLTGHCIYPIECNRWQSGCGSCPDLARPFSLKRDNTAFNWKLKQRIYRHIDIDVIVASRWMRDLAAKSPLAAGFRFHVVPFGLDLDRFQPGDVEAARKRLGIFPNHTVIAHRAVDNPYKGTEELKQALRQVETSRPICLLTTQDIGVFDEFIGKFQIIELGWTHDEDLLIASHQAADFYVMPSVAEAFGLMAIEAMACGKPVISFEGTSLPEVTFAPDIGMAVPARDPAALAAAITRWVESPDEVKLRGERARKAAETHYGLDLHLDRLVNVYRTVLQQRKPAAQRMLTR